MAEVTASGSIYQVETPETFLETRNVEKRRYVAQGVPLLAYAHQD